MKKNSRNKAIENKSMTPEAALRFLEDMRKLSVQRDEPTVAISLRVPANILRTLKTQAKIDGKKYQSLIIEYLRKGIQS